MFGLLKKECVVEPHDKVWVEQTVAWFLHKFGKEELLSFEIISPEIFKEGIGKTRSEFADFLFEKIRIAFKIPILDFQISYNQSREREVDGVGAIVGSIKEEGGVSAWSTFKEGKLIVYLDDSTLTNFDLLASNLSYFLCLHKLKQIHKFENVSGYNAEVAAIILGSEIFISNSIISHGQWNGVRMYGWSVGSRGFLTQQMAGYTISLVAFLKKESDLPLIDYFCLDVKGYIKQANKYIEQEKEYYSNFENGLEMDSIEKLPDYFHEKIVYYEGKRVRSISPMKNNVRHGITKYYYKNGTPWSEWEYKDGMPWTVLFNHTDKSEVHEKGTLKNGVGTLYSYNENGGLMYIWHYENGKLLKEEKF